MINTLELRSTLITALAGQIGIYTFSNNLSTPAVRAEDENYDEEPKVTGLEVVIQLSLKTSIAPLLIGVLGGAYEETSTAQITLKQWDIAKNTRAAMDATLAAIFQLEDVLLAGNPTRTVRSTKLDNIETCTIQIQKTEMVTIGD